MTRSVVTLALYVAVKLATGLLWHLVLFAETLAAAAPFMRADPIIPLGLAAIVVQGIVLIWLYPRVRRPGSALRSGLVFGALAGLFLAGGTSWAAVAKFAFADSVTYLVLATLYEVLSFAALGVLIALRSRETG